jgi:hypothetical protein
MADMVVQDLLVVALVVASAGPGQIRGHAGSRRGCARR